MDDHELRGPGPLRAFTPVLVLLGIVFLVTFVLPLLLFAALYLFGAAAADRLDAQANLLG
jgi:hypothetical protein